MEKEKLATVKRRKKQQQQNTNINRKSDKYQSHQAHMWTFLGDLRPTLYVNLVALLKFTTLWISLQQKCTCTNKILYFP